MCVCLICYVAILRICFYVLFCGLYMCYGVSLSVECIVFFDLVRCLTRAFVRYSLVFFFKQKTAYEMRISDWSSDVCSSDLQLKPKDLVIAPHDCYGGTYRLLKARADRGHFSLRFIDQSNHSAFAAVLEDVPALVLIETPSNPLMRVVDIAALASKAKAAGAMVAVDNTFLSPALQRPITLGADFVIHSTTKYLNGHSDVIG